MKIYILAIGKCKHGSAEEMLIKEYQKRLTWDLIIKEKENDTQEKEAEFLLKNIPNGAKVVVLDERGENMKSLDFAKRIGDFQNEGVTDICFLIGGADGHLDKVRKRADLLLSFGKLTMPHMLIRAVLTEQIYRAQTILNGHPYHRE
ncbi:MAG TPA: 23S rRNA (pseudouridine(1915)-N(3))-methyltransferase RlmH [Alphaproteobacteria bacterium]|nr:23S rRNA (pseudouridine(1915)-N(3))-methyltransferase RlmH [Alphaproteobacteria bacterium]